MTFAPSHSPLAWETSPDLISERSLDPRTHTFSATTRLKRWTHSSFISSYKFLLLHLFDLFHFTINYMHFGDSFWGQWFSNFTLTDFTCSTITTCQIKFSPENLSCSPTISQCRNQVGASPWLPLVEGNKQNQVSSRSHVYPLMCQKWRQFSLSLSACFIISSIFRNIIGSSLNYWGWNKTSNKMILDMLLQEFGGRRNNVPFCQRPAG